jgi:hypothetical protein
MSNSNNQKIWVHLEVHPMDLERELNRLAGEGYQIFKLFPLISQEGESEKFEAGLHRNTATERLNRMHVVAFHLMRFAELQQEVQRASTLQQITELTKVKEP